MTNLGSAKSEIILFGLLAVLAALIVLVPWKRLALRYNEYEAGKYHLGRAVTDKHARAQNPATWRVETEYSPASGTLELRLSREDNAPVSDLRLLAEFSTPLTPAPVASTVLRGEAHGVYRSDNVRLAKGDWLMSLTGIRRSEFVFRREQILRVD